MGIGGPGGGIHAFLGAVGLSVDDVVRHGVVEEDGVLGDDGDLAAHGVEVIVLHIDPIDQDLSPGDIEEPGNQVGKSRLSGPAAADQGDGFSFFHLELDVFQGRLRLLRIMKCPDLEFN